MFVLQEMFYFYRFNSLYGGGQEWIDPRCNIENNLPKRHLKIGISGGGSNFFLGTLSVRFYSKAVASGYVKVESIS